MGLKSFVIRAMIYYRLSMICKTGCYYNNIIWIDISGIQIIIMVTNFPFSSYMWNLGSCKIDYKKEHIFFVYYASNVHYIVISANWALKIRLFFGALEFMLLTKLVPNSTTNLHLYIPLQRIGANKAPNLTIKMLSLICTNVRLGFPKLSLT